MTHTQRVLPFVTVLLLSACVNMSGLDGTSDYGCKAPRGVQCNSVSGNYHNSLRNNPQAPRKAPAPAAGQSSAPEPRSRSVPAHEPNNESSNALAVTAPVSGAVDPAASSPLRSPGRQLRLWFKPWEDADRDLYDQGYVYVRIDDGRWLIEHAQRRIRDAYAPIRPPRAAGAGPGNPAKAASPADVAGAGAGAGSLAVPPGAGPGGGIGNGVE